MFTGNFIRKSAIGWLVVIITLTLISSFVLHDIMEHTHHKAGAAISIQEIFHSNDRKWWYSMLVFLVLLAAYSINKWKNEMRPQQTYRYNPIRPSNRTSNLFDPVLRALSNGALNPKLCD